MTAGCGGEGVGGGGCCCHHGADRLDSSGVSNHPNCISMGNLIKKSLLEVHRGPRVGRLRSTADAPHTAAASSRLPSPMHPTSH